MRRSSVPLYPAHQMVHIVIAVEHRSTGRDSAGGAEVAQICCARGHDHDVYGASPDASSALAPASREGHQSAERVPFNGWEYTKRPSILRNRSGDREMMAIHAAAGEKAE